MKEEMNVMETIETINENGEDVLQTCEEIVYTSSKSGGGFTRVVTGFIVAGAIAGGAWVCANWKDLNEKRKEKQIAKCCKTLEKYGCQVVRSEEEDFDDDFFEENENLDNEEN